MCLIDVSGNPAWLLRICKEYIVSKELYIGKSCMVAQDWERVHCVQGTTYRKIQHGSSGFGESTLCSRSYISRNIAWQLRIWKGYIVFKKQLIKKSCMVTQETMYQKYCTVAQILERVHRFQETIYQEILYGSPGFGECTLCPRNYLSGNPAWQLRI